MTSVDLPSLIGIVASALERRVLDEITAQGHTGVRTSHGYVFQRLLDAEPTIAELATALKITPQGASKVVKELETLGFVQRRTDTDARVRRVVLSESGADVVTIARRVRSEFSATLNERVGASAFAATMATLESAADSLGLAQLILDRALPLTEG